MKLKHVLQRSGGYEDANEDFDATSLETLRIRLCKQPACMDMETPFQSQRNNLGLVKYQVKIIPIFVRAMQLPNLLPCMTRHRYRKTYNVEAVIDRRRNKPRNALYKIKWDGYDMSNCTWKWNFSSARWNRCPPRRLGKKKRRLMLSTSNTRWFS